MKHINYINNTLYSITDICNIFNIGINKIINLMQDNNINYLYDSKKIFILTVKIYVNYSH